MGQLWLVPRLDGYVPRLASGRYVLAHCYVVFKKSRSVFCEEPNSWGRKQQQQHWVEHIRCDRWAKNSPRLMCHAPKGWVVASRCAHCTVCNSWKSSDQKCKYFVDWWIQRPDTVCLWAQIVEPSALHYSILVSYVHHSWNTYIYSFLHEFILVHNVVYIGRGWSTVFPIARSIYLYLKMLKRLHWKEALLAASYRFISVHIALYSDQRPPKTDSFRTNSKKTQLS